MEELADSLRGAPEPVHLQMLKLNIERLELLDRQIDTLNRMAADAETFPSEGEFASWAGVCPEENATAEVNYSSRSPKCCHFQSWFTRFLPRLGYKVAIWAVAHRLGRLIWRILHDGIAYIEQGTEPDPKTRKRRASKMAQALRKLGYNVVPTPLNPIPSVLSGA